MRWRSFPTSLARLVQPKRPRPGNRKLNCRNGGLGIPLLYDVSADGHVMGRLEPPPSLPDRHARRNYAAHLSIQLQHPL